MAHLRLVVLALPTQSSETIADYVGQPTHVSRMVTVALAMAKWLARSFTENRARQTPS